LLEEVEPPVAKKLKQQLILVAELKVVGLDIATFNAINFTISAKRKDVIIEHTSVHEVN
jgi:hypothetical protein